MVCKVSHLYLQAIFNIFLKNLYPLNQIHLYNQVSRTTWTSSKNSGFGNLFLIILFFNLVLIASDILSICKLKYSLLGLFGID